MDTPKGITGIPPPEKKPARWYKVLWPKVGKPLPFIFLDQCITGFWMHFGGFTVACDGTPHCRGCKAGFDLKWAGYAAGWSSSPKGLCVVSVTFGAVDIFLKEICQHGTLRGLSGILKRGGGKANGPVYVDLKGRVPEDQLVPTFDIMPSLRRVWGISEKYLFRGKPGPATREDCDPNDPRILRPAGVDMKRDDDFTEIPL